MRLSRRPADADDRGAVGRGRCTQASPTFGARSREHLATLCFDQRAEVRPITANGGLDRYGRTVAHVSCDGADASVEQVRAGMAWVFDRYVTDSSLYQLQDEGRAVHRGLWSDVQAVAPWEWRRAAR
jgi:micrococcal nuclease